MIKNLRLIGFKSYEDANISFGTFTVLVGGNASGKSNLIEALRLLCWMAQGQKLSSLQYEINNNHSIFRGLTKDLFHFYSAHPKFSLICSFENEKVKSNAQLSISIGIRNERDLHIEDESLESNEYGWLYKTANPSEKDFTEIYVEYNNFSRGGRKPQIKCSDQLGVFTQIITEGRISEKHKKANKTIPKVAGFAEQALSYISFLDPRPSAMRGYSFAGEKRLASNGENTSAVLYNLITETDLPKSKILDFIRSLPGQEISDINFIVTERKDVMVQLTESFPNHEKKVDATLLSDGTLRILSMAAALYSAPSGSMVVIEEIDNGVHPTRADGLLQNIYSIAQERKLQIVISTHNPALMNAVPNSVLKDVVFCYRDPNSGSSKLKALGEIPNFPDIIVQDQLGNLVTNRVIDKEIKNSDHQNNQDRISRALAWLASLD